ncbi:family 16 glycosylhydrolase [Granulosicoccus sp. 3-233]|uniref:glycoside hydrolase family 16 protein n=1 Tax=Granulosicoccus sp. 3-233 TaxID=3417969 RepID=UPI003D337658
MATLAACAESQPVDDDTVTPEAAAPAGRPDFGTQSNDGSNSVSYAQAVAAGEISDPDGPVIISGGVDIDSSDSDTAPETGAALPDTDSASEPDTVDNTPQNPFEAVPDAETDSSVGDDIDTDTDGPAEEDSEDDVGYQTGDASNQGGNDADNSSPDDESTVDTGTPDASESDPGSTDGMDTAEETPATAEPAEETSGGESTPPEASGNDTGENTSAENMGSSDTEEEGNSGKAKSHTTPGFEGEVIDGAIHVTWNADPLARGYNVYRQAKYVTTVMTNEYIDTDVFDRDYYYEIQAFDYDDVLYYIATGLTVSPRTLGKNDPDEPVANPNRLDDYELVFAEEFTGLTLDGSKWNTAYLWGSNLVINSEEQYYVDILRDPDFGFNPFTFDGEHMTINSIRTPPELAHKAMNQPYLSGVITSYDAFKFTYGYAEARAKMTFGRGYWPAFWLLNAYYGGDDPEIDIMEFIGQDQDVVYHTYHYYDAEGNLRSTKSKPTPGIDYTADFHTFAVEWMPGLIIYLVDGIEVHRVADSRVSSEEMYVIANTALGGWWAGSPDETTPFPGEYIIDYIRVYQRITPFDDVLLDDGVTNVPFADDIPGQSSPSHRPSPEQWPEGYPYRQR